MTIRIFQVDAFTNTPFSGNPAAVCLLSEPHSAQWMQQVGAEMNLSETAFLWPVDSDFSLRWFTPAAEVDLCGHATLAAAHILWETGELPVTNTAVFQTRSGELTAASDNGWIELNFPAAPPQPTALPANLTAALGIEPLFTGSFNQKHLIVVDGEDIVRQIDPDYSALRQVAARGVCVTSRATSPGIDFVSRYFAPWIGIDEDPVTGSAHCCLAPYWAAELGQEELVAYQASARGGLLRVRPSGNRVLISGQAVTVLEGRLLA
ncbi:MAG: PhzF family phenazine biosynthesis protein [Candidatus Promineifilaceae bacterium]|nr:PhzF family phenazine biosynthesis protein [Candidatus Promineifilaceae bacterium]